ncbi:hypothetical protein SAMN05216252_11699 [Actinacidiphila glaucinigra]|uniref:Uncharacterized protein n=1 Tax=Actinacidiphila glaucinigra TaxID=235986 RepID=A0A239KQL3_9ACTN|nr:hypothetical protein SAMN05216252_11699 [Actinacidiphila glaucinigra]
MPSGCISAAWASNALHGTKTSGFALFRDAATRIWRFEMPTSHVAAPTEDVVYNCGVKAAVVAS